MSWVKKKPFLRVSINGGTPITLSVKNFFPVCTKILHHEGVSKTELNEALKPAVDFIHEDFFTKSRRLGV